MSSLDMQKIREQESLLGEKNAEIERLQQQLASLADKYTEEKEHNRQSRTLTIEDLSEFKTRKIYIDAMLFSMNWKLEGPDSDVSQEYEVEGMADVPGQKGYADYVLWGRDHKPLAVVEAKKACKDPNTGRTQANLYADCLERRFGQRPVMFTTNGFDTFFWDDKGSTPRKVSCIFSRADLEKIIERRSSKLPLEKHQHKRRHHKPLLSEGSHPRCMRRNQLRRAEASSRHGDRHRQNQNGRQPSRCTEPGASHHQRALPRRQNGACFAG